VYGNDYDSALHLAIKHGPTKAAMALIDNGANVDFPNAKVSSLSSLKKFAAEFFCVSILICMHCNCVI
jgi:ankyrin repeat protein